MKMLTIGEASGNLAAWLQLAIAGEEIAIRSGETVVALRPLSTSAAMANASHMTPREALQALQTDAKLTPSQAEAYLKQVRAERRAAEERHSA